MNKGGLILRKQEMTKLWIDGKYVPVTLLRVADQSVLRHKTQEKDGYDAIVVGVEKKELNKEKGIKEKFAHMTEFKVTDDLFESFKSGDKLDLSVLEGAETVTVIGTSKGAGFAGVIKRHNFAGGPASHGSKFHRLPGSIGNRKPRRVNKGHPLPGHMGLETIKLKNIQIVERYNMDNEQLIAVKGSIPGSYNGIVKIELN